jgi:hypothetical protein
MRCPETGTLVYIISLRHWFFRDRRFAESGFPARVANSMQWPMPMALEISFASDTLGKEIGDGIGRMIGTPSGQDPGWNCQIDCWYDWLRHGRGRSNH